MLKADPKWRLVQVGPAEALALQLGTRAAQAAGEALRLGGHRPTAAQLARISRELTREALAAALALTAAVQAGAAPPSDDDLDAAADMSGAAKVSEVVGAPAVVN